jgi:hypothetical protein
VVRIAKRFLPLSDFVKLTFKIAPPQGRNFTGLGNLFRTSTYSLCMTCVLR